MPSLPSVGDFAILTSLWHNSLPPTTYLIKLPEWRTLEDIGDIVIRQICFSEIREIFGENNYELNAIIKDHANSNQFFEALVVQYKLRERVQYPPTKKEQQYSKAMGDIFEACIGAHVRELLMWDSTDPLKELRYFLKRIWELRYGQLKIYFYNSFHCHNSMVEGKRSEPSVKIIKSGDDPLMRNTLGDFLNAQNVIRDIGYLAQVEIEYPEKDSWTGNNRTYTAFAPTEEEAFRMANGQSWCNQGKSPLPPFP